MGYRYQSGVVLVVTLLLLTVMTALVISSINMGTVNLRILDNMRAQQEAHAVVDAAVNQFVSNETNFDPPESATITKGDYTVTITQPECVATGPADGYSAKWSLSPEDSTWEFQATLDHSGSADVQMTQGVEIRMAAGSC